MTLLETLSLFRRKRAVAGERSSSPGIPTVAPEITGSARDDMDDSCRNGDTLLGMGKPEAALEAYQRAIDCGIGSAAGHLGQARAYLAMDRIGEAADSLAVALAIEPSAVDAIVLLARIHRDAGATDEALGLLRRARSLAPADERILTDLASTLNRSGQTDEAIDTYVEAIQAAPHDPRPRVNLGLIYLLQRGNPLLAETHFRSALAVAPDQVEAHANLGLALHDQGRYEEEFEVYRRALLDHPESTELRWNRALANLSTGNFNAGWEGYDLRFSRRGGRDLSRFKYSVWDGSPLPDSRLLVLAEQGLGDEIMFASCIPDLTPMVKGVVLESAPRLARLFARSFPQVEVHGRDRHASLEWLQCYPEIAAKTPIGSLPRRLRKNQTDFPNHQGYLQADQARADVYRRRLADGGAAMTVGLSWRGGTSATRSELRSVSLAALRPLLSASQVRFVCLQHRLNPEERNLALGMRLTLLEDVLTDIDELAALVSTLDLVITVDNLNLHMAGALGRPAWGLLGLSPDWRWPCRGGMVPWYPSTLLFRVNDFGGWEGMLENVAARLKSSL